MTRAPYGEWTAERMDLFRDMYPNHGTSDRTMNAINALPGRPFTKPEALVYKASTIGLRLTKEAHKRRMMEGIRKADAAAKSDTTPTFSNGFRHAPLVAVPEPEHLSPAEQTALADAARERKITRALTMLAKRNADPAIVAAACGLKLREACMLAGRMRMGLA